MSIHNAHAITSSSHTQSLIKAQKRKKNGLNKSKERIKHLGTFILPWMQFNDSILQQQLAQILIKIYWSINGSSTRIPKRELTNHCLSFECEKSTVFFISYFQNGFSTLLSSNSYHYWQHYYAVTLPIKAICLKIVFL